MLIQNSQIDVVLRAFKQMGATDIQLKLETEKLSKDVEYLNSWLDCLMVIDHYEHIDLINL